MTDDRLRETLEGARGLARRLRPDWFGPGTGAFTSSLSGLKSGLIYHIRAYATNSQGTVYGRDLTFTTSGK